MGLLTFLIGLAMSIMFIALAISVDSIVPGMAAGTREIFQVGLFMIGFISMFAGLIEK